MAEKTEKKRKRISRRNRVLAVILTVLLAALGALVFLYRDYLTSDSLGELFAEEEGVKYEPYTYETGTGEIFASAGSGLAVASSTGIQLLDSSGGTAARHIFAMSEPTIAASPVNCAFCDLGGTTLRVLNFNGEYTTLDTERDIISVTANDSGWLAVTTEESGYKGKVTVYDAKLTAVYEWYSGASYVLSARVSPDCRSLAVLCASGGGGTVRFYSLSATEEKAAYVCADRLIFDLSWDVASTLVCVTDTGLVFIGTDGTEKAALDFGGLYLIDYELTDDFGAVLLSRYLNGSSGTLVTFSSQGERLGEAEIHKDLLSLSASGGKLLALYSDSLVLYSDTLTVLGEREGVLGVKKALLRPSGDALLLSSYSAQTETF